MRTIIYYNHETWKYVWECPGNEIIINEIVEENFKKFKMNLLNEVIGNKTIELWIERIKKVLYKRSWDQNNTILHEIIKGIVNKRVCLDDCNNKLI